MFTAYIRDITERKQMEQELTRQAEQNRHLALHDALTGLPNRTLFTDRIRQAILAAEREGDELAVLMMDLDRFKEINDALGHRSGDVVLKEIARRLPEAVRESDTVCRLGGDEFGILLPRRGDGSAAGHVVERIRGALERPLLVGGLPLSVEASIGAAFYPVHGTDVGSLLQRADVAMYQAKGAHTGYAVYDPAHDEYDAARLRLVSDLRGAIGERQLLLHYQPKADLGTGRVTGVEALVRWDHPRHGLLFPDAFVPVAEQTGLMKPLARFVLGAALAQCRAWQRAGFELTVAVNLSMRNLLDVQLPDEIAGLLREWEVEPGRLELEITESAILSDPFRAKAVLGRLEQMGVRIAIDDFGTGYSSLAFLRRFPIDQIKIDRSFITNMAEDEDDAIIVRSTIDLARNLGLEVVGEGVETQEVWERLARMGCDMAQGYYLSRPLPPGELVRWLERGSPLERLVAGKARALPE